MTTRGRPEYARHLDTIRHRLPPDLLGMQESTLLHDARLREWAVMPADGTARLVLDSYAGDERFTLTYSGVERFESTADPAVGLGGPHGYGDFGYDEVDVLGTGAFEHRMIFHPGSSCPWCSAGSVYDGRGERNPSASDVLLPLLAEAI